ncbi:MAG: outer membrane protein assembly factor BamE [Gammaproteobacteria bacterium]
MAPSATYRRLPALWLVAALLAGTLVLASCVYRIDVQQGNLLDQKDIEAIQPGMTRSQVRYLLGTPVSADAFQTDRWDYMYYLRPGKSRKAPQRWVIVWFDGDTVNFVDPDVLPGTNPDAKPPADRPPSEKQG